MLEAHNSTFTFQLFIRTFTLSDKSLTTDETLSFDNVEFIGNDLIIKYTNI